MTLDTENHRAVLLHAVGKSAWPGEFAAEVAALLDAIKNASVAPQSGPMHQDSGSAED